MTSFNEWMSAYQRANGVPVSVSTSCRVPPDLVFAFANNDPQRWRSLVGCQIRLLGRGFGELLRVVDLTLWLQLESAIGDKNSDISKSVAVNVSKLEDSRITAVLFPAGFKHVLVHAAVILHKVDPTSRSLPSTGPSMRYKDRIEPGTSDTCSHGIPFYRRCYICKPGELG